MLHTHSFCVLTRTHCLSQSNRGLIRTESRLEARERRRREKRRKLSKSHSTCGTLQKTVSTRERNLARAFFGPSLLVPPVADQPRANMYVAQSLSQLRRGLARSSVASRNRELELITFFSHQPPLNYNPLYSNYDVLVFICELDSVT